MTATDEDARASPRHLLLVALVAAAPYAQTLGFDFTYDDQSHIVRSPVLRDLANADVLLPWRYLDAEFPDQGRPALVASHFLDLWIGGPGPAGYHLQSVLWHVIATMLVFAFGRRVGLAPAAAGAAAVLFALHPVHAEAVAAISNREDPMATVLVLVALLSARLWLRTGRWAPLAGALIAHLGALLSKESAVVAPLLLVWVLACCPDWRPAAEDRRRLYAVGAAAAVVVTLAWGAFQLRLGYPSLLPGAGGAGLEVAVATGPGARLAMGPALLFQPSLLADGPPDDPAGPRRPHEGVGLHHGVAAQGFRAAQLLVPWPLSPEYDLATFGHPLAVAAGALLLLLLALVAARERTRRPALALGAGWFLIATLPVSFATLLVNPVADRYQYMPAVGAMIAVGWACMTLAPSMGSPRIRQLGPALAATLALAFAVLAVRQISFWRDDLTLFTEAARHAPRSPRVLANLGVARLSTGDTAGARDAFEAALDADPEHVAARYDLAVVEARAGHLDLAEGHLRRAVDARGVVGEAALQDKARRDLTAMLRRQGRHDEADALERAPH